MLGRFTLKREVRVLRKQHEKLSNQLQTLLENRNAPGAIDRIHAVVAKIRALNARVAEMTRKRPAVIIEPWQKDKALVELNSKLSQKILEPLRCPKCGELDRGNTVNGEPWCLRCNISLRKKFRKPIRNWRKNTTFKPLD